MKKVWSSAHPSPDVSDFSKYLLSEYSNMAKAHFKTVDTISSFFRHYLVIMSVPIALLAFFLRAPMSEGILRLFSPWLGWCLFVVLLVISFAGLGVMFYVINLRMDSILYARTINAIRKYFYDRAPMDADTKLRMRALPQSRYQPPYYEPRYFIAVVLSFGVIDTLYLFLALVANCIANQNGRILAGSPFETLPWWPYIGAISGLALHYLLYRSQGRYCETQYLRSHTIGVDVDGVLNEHRTHFCKFLKRNAGKNLQPGRITVMPVHENVSLRITEEDESKVFNDPEYWIQMPPVECGAKNLRKIRNRLKLKVYVFSHRDWPKAVGQERSTVADRWQAAVSCYCEGLEMGVSRAKHRFMKPINRITRLWLREHGFEYDKLIVEKGNEEIADPQAPRRNRFYISRKENIRFFVEDDLRKAVKLAYICEVVFLVDHPYNRVKTGLPGNIIRVKSWDEIYKEIRKFS